MKQKFFKEAKKASQKSPSNPALGCVLVKGRRIVSFGFNNMSKTHPKMKNGFGAMHAEFHAILGNPVADLIGCDAYIYREYKNGTPAMSRPCAFCLEALRKAGIRKIHYTTNGGYSSERL